jgi:hypothetical protein
MRAEYGAQEIRQPTILLFVAANCVMQTRNWAGLPRPLDDDRMSDGSRDCLRRDYRLAIVRPATDDRSVARVRDDDHFARITNCGRPLLDLISSSEGWIP